MLKQMKSLYRRRERLSLQYAIKLSSTPNNPTFDTVFRPKYSEIFAIRPNAIPTFGLRIKDLIDEANINIETIRQATIPESTPWQLESPLIIYGLKTVKKVDTNPLVFQGLFNDVQDKYFDHQFLYTDGSKDDHKVGCAVVSNLLGHTYTSHRYLLAGDDPPVCISCQENLTVEHILIHCAEYFHVRIQCFDIDNLQELFNTVSPDTILRFIQRARLLSYLVKNILNIYF